MILNSTRGKMRLVIRVDCGTNMLIKFEKFVNEILPPRFSLSQDG